MDPGHWAKETPDRPALVVARSGETVTHCDLDRRSNQLARTFRAVGLGPDDHVAVFMENSPRFHEVVWAALRSGLIVTPINRYLTAEEAGYILDNCGAKACVTSAALAGVAAELPSLAGQCVTWLMTDGTVPGFEPYEAAIAAQPTTPMAEQPLGDFMLYSSGTTGQPKGIVRQRSKGDIAQGLPFVPLIRRLFNISAGTVYLSPAPLYHSAPLAFTVAVQSLGGTVIMMDHFDPEEALAAIERYGVTHSQWVPTMFSRLLKLPEDVRRRHDLSSQQVVIHAAAPCPRTVKEAMFEWWGPIIHEYYGGTEGSGQTYCGPEEWLAHPGTVGRPVVGVIHICDENGVELPAGREGTIYFERDQPPFDYHKAPDQTRATRHAHHPTWTTLSDVGILDEDGFLYLTDRLGFMIISGGVNIYPREVEDCMITHPAVEDVAVFGVPNDDLGEEVKAVVQLASGMEPGPDIERELRDWTRARLTHYKCPKSIDFEAQLPRLPTGKLYKRVLRDPYWVGR